MINKNITTPTLFFMLSFLCREVLAQSLAPIKCGDLLAEYATTPEFISNKIHFEKCEAINQQIAIMKATYRVEAQNSVEVENYFANKYNIPKMKWAEKICYNGICVLSNGYGGIDFNPEKANTLGKGLVLSYGMSGYYDILKTPNHQTNERKYINSFRIEISLAQSP